jgi:4'-phosphopantetheinyl transferase
MMVPPHAVVQLWDVTLDCDGAELKRLQSFLSQDEQARAARFHFARDAHRFIAGRGLLRETLALYLSLPAAQLRFAYGEWGKPYLAEHPSLCFNLAHSDSRALIVVAREVEVGVDIERVRTDLQIAALANLALCEAEKCMLRQLHGTAQQEAFFQLWTRKEAYIKADGRGISLPLPQLDVSNSDGRITRLDEQSGTWQTCRQWRLRAVEAGSNYAAAVACNSHDWKLEVIQRSQMD